MTRRRSSEYPSISIDLVSLKINTDRNHFAQWKSKCKKRSGEDVPKKFKGQSKFKSEGKKRKLNLETEETSEEDDVDKVKKNKRSKAGKKSLKPNYETEEDDEDVPDMKKKKKRRGKGRDVGVSFVAVSRGSQ